MSQTIGFIGVGQIGGTVAQLAVAAGYNVVLSNSRGPETLTDVVNALGPQAKADTSANIAQNKDIEIIVLSIPLNAVPTLLPSLDLKNKVILDTSNYYPQRDTNLEELDSGKITTCEYVAKYLEDSNKLVKVFNNIASIHLKISATQDPSKQTILPIAGDSADAKKAATQFINKLGYKTYDVGALKEGWRYEPGTTFYGSVYMNKVPEGLDHDELKQFFKNTVAPPMSEEQAQKYLESAKRPEKVGGSIEGLPKVWLEIIMELYVESAKAKAANSSKLI